MHITSIDFKDLQTLSPEAIILECYLEWLCSLTFYDGFEGHDDNSIREHWEQIQTKYGLQIGEEGWFHIASLRLEKELKLTPTRRRRATKELLKCKRLQTKRENIPARTYYRVLMNESPDWVIDRIRQDKQIIAELKLSTIKERQKRRTNKMRKLLDD